MFKVVPPLLRLRSGLTGTLVIFVSGFLLTACILTADQSVEGNPKDPRAQDIADKIRSLDLLPRDTAEVGSSGIKQPGSSRPAIYLSDGKTSPGTTLTEREDTGSGSGYDLNFENAPVATVAKVILGDVLGVGYTIDPRVQGTVTLASVRPVPKADALYVLENALRMSGVALLRDRSGYRLLPANEAGPGGVDRTASAEAGQGISVVPLRYVSAQTVFKLLDAFGVKATTLRPDTARNTLIITGSGSDRAAAIDTILSFDADWMKGQSVGIFPVRNSSPEPLISELEKIMDSGDGGLSQNVVKFQPMSRLNSILVVSQKPEYLKRAGTWIARLDKSDTQAANMKSYPLRYANSKLIVALLNDMLFGRGGGGGSLDNSSSQISPGSGISMSSSGSGGPIAALSGLPTQASGAPPAVATASATASPLNVRGAPNPGGAGATGGAQDYSGGLLGSGGKPAGGAILPNVRITADITNNAVLVYADQESQRIVEQTIRQIDRPQRQIAIEATIAEVTLNDQLNYGVQFFLASQKGSIVNTVATAPGSSHLTRHRTCQQRCQRRRRRAVGPRASRLQFPDRRREFAARHSRRAAQCHRRQSAVQPVAGGARQPDGNAAGRRPGAVLDRQRDRADRGQYRGEHHRLQEHRHHFACAAARQRFGQCRARHRAGDQQRGPGNGRGIADADDIAAAGEEFDRRQ